LENAIREKVKSVLENPELLCKRGSSIHRVGERKSISPDAGTRNQAD
jgi:hypothetical protein